jgi:gamma-glutamyl-gamma-aminobutyrate hydrolase PuuD
MINIISHKESAHQNIIGIQYHPSQDAYHPESNNILVKMWTKNDIYTLLVGL